MATALKLVQQDANPAQPRSIDGELRSLLRAEVAAARKLSQIRANIGPAKRAYLEKHKCFGMSNEALRKELGVRG